jgi:hypothetical protein
MSGPKRRTIEVWLAALEARLPKPEAKPAPPEVAAAFHDAALAVHERTGSAKLARRSGLAWATAVAADLTAGRPARPRFAIGGEPTAEGREALDRLLAEVGWAPAGTPQPWAVGGAPAEGQGRPAPGAPPAARGTRPADPAAEKS